MALFHRLLPSSAAIPLLSIQGVVIQTFMKQSCHKLCTDVNEEVKEGKDHPKNSSFRIKPLGEGVSPLWSTYRRNFKGQLSPKQTRKKCIYAGGKIVSGNPCPICKLQLEKGVTLSWKEPNLLSHFVCPHTWHILPAVKTGVCRTQQKKLEKAVMMARDFGLLPFEIPHHTDEPPQPKRPIKKPRNARYWI